MILLPTAAVTTLSPEPQSLNPKRHESCLDRKVSEACQEISAAWSKGSSKASGEAPTCQLSLSLCFCPCMTTPTWSCCCYSCQLLDGNGYGYCCGSSSAASLATHLRPLSPRRRFEDLQPILRKLTECLGTVKTDQAGGKSNEREPGIQCHAAEVSSSSPRWDEALQGRRAWWETLCRDFTASSSTRYFDRSLDRCGKLPESGGFSCGRTWTAWRSTSVI